MWTAEEAVAYIHTYGWQQHAPGLGRIRALLAALGDPQRSLRFVHAAGTNGKGSTCAMTAAVLRAAGYRVGLNTSPHLVRFSERIQVDGQPIPDEDLARLTASIRPAAEAMPEHPTEFELITALAMLYFQEQQCSIVVLETGLGGALDASNVIDPPEAVLLTAMGMDHSAILGSTMTQVAEAKAGIIKPGTPTISLGGCPEADAVFRRTAMERGSPFIPVDLRRIRPEQETLDGTRFICAPYGTLTLPLPGDYQLRNAALAITALEVLRTRGWTIPDDAIRQGLAAVHWPGRLEVLRKRDPVVLVDGAHNENGMAAALDSLRSLLPGEKPVFLLGMMGDKEVPRMLDLLAPMAAQVFTAAPEGPRAMPPEELARLVRERGVPARACADPRQAMQLALSAAGKGGAVCILGSLYLVGAVLEAAEDQH